jgi:hypothetical protein
MKLRLCSIIALALLAAGVFTAGTENASAQSLKWALHGAKAGTALPPDLMKVNYFSNANTAGAPDGTIQLTNPGTSGGNICAQIYVFDPNQEMSECCACLITPNGLRTLSVNADLTSNPLTGVQLTTGEVSIVSGFTSNNVCSPLNGVVISGFRAWGTHIQNSNFSITETEYSDRQLSTGNDNLLNDCYAIALDGSGHGVCSCGTGD